MLMYAADMDAVCREVARAMSQGGCCIVTANALRNYPHVHRYREQARKLLGWPSIATVTERLCVENMRQVLERSFAHVDLTVQEGRLCIPLDAFARWFESMLLTWSPVPSAPQRGQILRHLTQEWAVEDLDLNGNITEPKWVGLALCRP